MRLLNNIKQIYGKQILYREFWRQFKVLEKQTDTKKTRLSLIENEVFPCLWDNTPTTPFDMHYVYHVAWALRKIKEINPELHVDISSSLNFCTTLSAFIPVEFYDYRPANLKLSNLKSLQADLTNLHFESNSLQCLSCMHTVEHIGLGRYGDPLDYDGDLKAIDELKRVTSINGNLLFVVPVGKPKIVFNAHRIYSYSQILSYFKGFDLIEFSLITDDDKGGQLILNAREDQADMQEYGCGCFCFKKREA